MKTAVLLTDLRTTLSFVNSSLTDYIYHVIHPIKPKSNIAGFITGEPCLSDIAPDVIVFNLSKFAELLTSYLAQVTKPIKVLTSFQLTVSNSLVTIIKRIKPDELNDKVRPIICLPKPNNRSLNGPPMKQRMNIKRVQEPPVLTAKDGFTDEPLAKGSKGSKSQPLATCTSLSLTKDGFTGEPLKKYSVLAYVHVGNYSIFKSMLPYLDNLVANIHDVHIVINIIDEISLEEQNQIRSDSSSYPNVSVYIRPNRGFDLGGFFAYLNVCKKEKIAYDYVVQLHTKTDIQWRKMLAEPLVGSVERIQSILTMFEKDPTLGLIASNQAIFYSHNTGNPNLNHLTRLLGQFMPSVSPRQVLPFNGGTMFWIRFNILKDVFFTHDLDSFLEEFNNVDTFDWNWYIFANNPRFYRLSEIKDPAEAKQHYDTYAKLENLSGNLLHAIKYNTASYRIRDAMFEHACERMFPYIVIGSGYTQHFIEPI